MTLENFRKMKVSLNGANRAVYKKLLAKEGDLNGRELEVQLVDGSMLEDLKDVELVLYWKNLSMGNQGDKYFDAVDRKKGIFKVSYPESMLNRGNVTCSIAIIQGGERITNTLNFTVQVQGSGYGAQTAIASDDFQALNDALITVSKYQNEIDDILDSIIQAGDSLIATEKSRIRDILNAITPRIDGLESQFNDAVANVTSDSEVIVARSSTTTGESHGTIGKRMDGIEEMQVANNLDTNKKHKVYLEVESGQPRLRLEEI